MVVADRPRVAQRRQAAWRLGGLAVAACIGGLLVLAGVWAAGGVGGSLRPGQERQVAVEPGTPPSVANVSAEQMQQVAKVFALHESVAGPLAWYAADDQNIRLASAQGGDVSQTPIAVLLRLAPTGPNTTARTLVIVCRQDQPATIELPAESPDRTGLRVYLDPRAVNGKVEMQYAIAVDGRSRQAPRASLSGQRLLGLAETSLGQLALGEGLLNVDATAWAMAQERN
jgi:hypothetical protein